MPENDLKAQAAREANLPPFCTITNAVWTDVTVPDESGAPTSKRVIFASFTFPGATGHGSWWSHLRDMVYVAGADYDLYQRLKAEWIDGGQGDDGG